MRKSSISTSSIIVIINIIIDHHPKHDLEGILSLNQPDQHFYALVVVTITVLKQVHSYNYRTDR